MRKCINDIVIKDLTWECGCYFANAPANTTPTSQNHYVTAVIQQIRSQPYITPLVQKCYQVRIHTFSRYLQASAFTCLDANWQLLSLI